MADLASGGETRPATIARVYDYHLGGARYCPADREVAEATARLFPPMPVLARTGRAFMHRAVRYVAGQGIRQFLDLGSGIPSGPNVHEIAGAFHTDGRVVYVDIDPVSVAEMMDLLAGQHRHVAVWGDIRDPASILGNPRVREALDLTQPIGLLLLGVLHFVPDDDAAHDVVRAYTRAVVPGSYLAISHLTSDQQDIDQAELDAAKDVYQQRTGTPLKERARAQVEAFFHGLHLVEPGVTWTPLWRPEAHDPAHLCPQPSASASYAGVAHVPAAGRAERRR